MGLAGRVWAEIGADASGLKKGVNEAITTLGNLGKSASSAGASGASALAGLGLGAISLQSALMLADRAAQMLKDTWEFAEQGAQIASLSQASSRLAQAYGGNMAEIVSSVKEASFNTITEYDIMKGANLAMTMGISSNTTEISQLMQIAIERGRAFGLSTEEAFDRITRGIGRRSTKILDDLGFTANAIQANKEYAASLGISTNELNDNMKVRALFEMILKQGNAELAKQGGLMMDISTPYQRLSTLYTEFMNKQKEFAASAALPFIASDEEIQNLYKQSAALALTSGNYEEYIKYAGYARTSYGRNMGSLSKGVGFTKDDFSNLFQDINKLSAMSGLGSRQAKSEQEFADAINNANIALEVQAGLAGEAEKAFDKYNSISEQYGQNSEQTIAATEELEESISSLMFEMANASGEFEISGEAQMKMAMALDLVSEKSVMMQAAMTALNEKYDANKNGILELGEMTIGYMADLGALNALFTDREANWKLYIDVIQRGGSATFPGIKTGGAMPRGNPENLFRHGGSFIGMAHGGIVPPGFSNDGMPLWVSSGERVDVTPAGNKSVDGQGNTMRFYGPVTFKVDKDIRTTNLMEQLRQ